MPDIGHCVKDIRQFIQLVCVYIISRGDTHAGCGVQIAAIELFALNGQRRQDQGSRRQILHDGDAIFIAAPNEISTIQQRGKPLFDRHCAIHARRPHTFHKGGADRNLDIGLHPKSRDRIGKGLCGDGKVFARLHFCLCNCLLQAGDTRCAKKCCG